MLVISLIRFQSAKDSDLDLFERHLHYYCHCLIIITADIYAYCVPSPPMGTLYYQVYSQDITMRCVTVGAPILQI